MSGYYGYNPAHFGNDYGFIGDALGTMGKMAQTWWDGKQVQDRMNKQVGELERVKSDYQTISDNSSQIDVVQDAYLKGYGEDYVLNKLEGMGSIRKDARGQWVRGDKKKAEKSNGVMIDDGRGNTIVSRDLLGLALRQDMRNQIDRIQTQQGEQGDIQAVRSNFDMLNELGVNFSTFAKPMGEVDPEIYSYMQQSLTAGNNPEALKQFRQGMSDFKSKKEWETFISPESQKNLVEELPVIKKYTIAEDGSMEAVPENATVPVMKTPDEIASEARQKGVSQNSNYMQWLKTEYSPKYFKTVIPQTSKRVNDALLQSITFAGMSKSSDSFETEAMSKEMFNPENYSRAEQLSKMTFQTALQSSGMEKHWANIPQQQQQQMIRDFDATKQDMINVWNASVKGKDLSLMRRGGGGQSKRKTPLSAVVLELSQKVVSEDMATTQSRINQFTQDIKGYKGLKGETEKENSSMIASAQYNLALEKAKLNRLQGEKQDLLTYYEELKDIERKVDTSTWSRDKAHLKKLGDERMHSALSSVQQLPEEWSQFSPAQVQSILTAQTNKDIILRPEEEGAYHTIGIDEDKSGTLSEEEIPMSRTGQPLYQMGRSQWEAEQSKKEEQTTDRLQQMSMLERPQTEEEKDYAYGISLLMRANQSKNDKMSRDSLSELSITQDNVVRNLIAGGVFELGGKPKLPAYVSPKLAKTKEGRLTSAHNKKIAQRIADELATYTDEELTFGGVKMGRKEFVTKLLEDMLTPGNNRRYQDLLNEEFNIQQATIKSMKPGK